MERSYRRYKNYRKRQLRKKIYKIKLIISRILTLSIVAIIIIASCWIHHVDSLCTDIYKATDYYLTVSMFNSKKLSKIDSITLQYCDTTSAVVQVDGLNYDSPHDYVSYTAYFTKAKNSSWKLDNIYVVSSNNSYKNQSKE